MRKKSLILVLIFSLGLILFNWPILTIPQKGGTGILFAYLFAAWGGIILLLLTVFRSASTDQRRKDRRSETDPEEHV